MNNLLYKTSTFLFRVNSDNFQINSINIIIPI